MKQHDWLSIKEAAASLGVCAETIRRLLRRGVGPPFVKVSEKLVRIERGMFERWLDERTSNAAQDGNSLPGKGDANARN